MKSSVNPYFTFHYSQPEQYHFSHDSVFLARKIFEVKLDLSLENKSALDICSGSGIVGLDFLFHRKSANKDLPLRFDFLEIQKDYEPYFLENVTKLGPVTSEIHFLNLNYEALKLEAYKNKYDLVMSGPPYFLVHQGKLSPNEFRNRCRFFIDSDLTNLIEGIANCLKPGGECLMLLRDLPAHKWNMIEEAQNISAGFLEMKVLGDILGTHFVSFKKLELSRD